MKWRAKGHEFDEVGENFSNVKIIYVWGTGAIGIRMVKLLLNMDIEIKLLNIVPNGTIEICGEKFRVYPATEALKQNANEKLLLIALGENNLSNACSMAIHEGWEINKNCFTSLSFDMFYYSIFGVYCKDKLCLNNGHVITLSFNEYCTLKCKNCSANIPYITPSRYPLENVKKDADVLFDRIDYAEIVRMGGGRNIFIQKFIGSCTVL